MTLTDRKARRLISLAITLLLLACMGIQTAAAQLFTCADKDQAGICISLGVKTDHTEITSIRGFQAVQGDLTVAATTNGAQPVAALFEQAASFGPVKLGAKWVLQLQKKLEGGSFVTKVTACSSDGGKTITITHMGATASAEPSMLWNAVYSQIDDGGKDASDAQVLYYSAWGCGDVLPAPPSPLPCPGADCRIVLSTQSLPADFGLRFKRPGDTPMPMNGGSVDFRIGKTAFGTARYKGKRMIVEAENGNYISGLDLGEVKSMYYSRNLTGKNWTITVLPQKVRIKGRDRGRKIIFEARKDIKKLNANAYGEGARFVSSDPITRVTLKTRWFCSEPIAFPDQSVHVFIHATGPITPPPAIR